MSGFHPLPAPYEAVLMSWSFSHGSVWVAYEGTAEELVRAGVATTAMTEPGKPGRRRLDPLGRHYVRSPPNRQGRLIIRYNGLSRDQAASLAAAIIWRQS